MICSVCGNKSSVVKSAVFKDYYFCPRCTASFNKTKNVNYDKKYFLQHNKKSVISLLAQPFLDIFLDQKVNQIKNILSNDGKVLDYGCGSGRLVEALNKSGVDCIGFEPSKAAVRLAQQNNIPVFPKLKKVKGGYDLIMMWHSLEHINNAGQILKKLTGLLSKSGKIMIAVPNGDSWEAVLLKEKWFHYSFPLHCIQFNPHALKHVLEKNKFKHINFDYINPEYTFSGLVQSLLNIFLPMNVMYSTLTNRRLELPLNKAIILTIISLTILIILSPLILLAYIVLLIFKKTDAIVVTAWK